MPDTDFEEKMIVVRRTAKTYQGGRRFRFGALVAIGDRQGWVKPRKCLWLCKRLRTMPAVVW